MELLRSKQETSEQTGDILAIRRHPSRRHPGKQETSGKTGDTWVNRGQPEDIKANRRHLGKQEIRAN